MTDGNKVRIHVGTLEDMGAETVMIMSTRVAPAHMEMIYARKSVSPPSS